MIDHETALRIIAVAVAVAVVAVPVLAKKIRLPSLPSPASDSIKDAHTVLEIASRLRAAGNVKGVELCQQIIDAILKPEVKK